MWGDIGNASGIAVDITAWYMEIAKAIDIVKLLRELSEHDGACACCLAIRAPKAASILDVICHCHCHWR